MTITNSQCSAYGDKIRESVAAFYNPRITALQKIIDDEVNAGRDPTQYTIEDGAVIMNLPKLLLSLEKMKETGNEKASQAESSCDAEAVPDWIGDANKVSDIAMGIAMLPFILLTGNLAAAHIDFAEIYHGTPFGGKNALIPKMRDDVLDFLQISGDVRKFINDPFNSTTDFFSQGLEDLKEWLRKPFG